MTDFITWFNTELVRLWPILLVAVPLAWRWIKRRVKAYVDSKVAELRAGQTASAAVMGEVHEQVRNSHTTNLRHDLDAIHDDVRVVMRMNETHFDWSQEWSNRIDKHVDEHGVTLIDHERRLAALEARIQDA